MLSYHDHAVRFDPGITMIGGDQLVQRFPLLVCRSDLPCRVPALTLWGARGNRLSSSLSIPVGIRAALAIRITAAGISHGGRERR
jgi:hypothetical protein